MLKSGLARVTLFALLAVTAVVVIVFLPVKDLIRQFLAWVEELGFWGPVVLAAAYVPACVLLVPGSLLTLGAGFAFGVVEGTIAVSLGSVAGASAAFFVGRFLARDWVEKQAARNPRFRALDQAVATQGFKIVLLTRLSPVFPFNLLNYMFGLTRVRFRDYFFASWLGMLPGTVMYVYLGTAARTAVTDLAELGARQTEGGVAQQVLFYVGLLATVVVTVFVTRLARQALARAVPEQAEQIPVAPEEIHS